MLQVSTGSHGKRRKTSELYGKRSSQWVTSGGISLIRQRKATGHHLNFRDGQMEETCWGPSYHCRKWKNNHPICNWFLNHFKLIFFYHHKKMDSDNKKAVFLVLAVFWTCFFYCLSPLPEDIFTSTMCFLSSFLPLKLLDVLSLLLESTLLDCCQQHRQPVYIVRW